MRDPRLDKLAAVLVGYSTGVKKADLVRINASVPALPLVEAVYEAILRAGGHPFVQLATDEMSEIFYRVATDDQLKYVSPINQFLVENTNVYIGLWGGQNTKGLTHVDPKKQSLTAQARKPYLTRFLERAAKRELRWVGTQFPTPSAAQDAEMSLFEYESFVFAAGLLHLADPVAAWQNISARQQRLCDFLNTTREIRILAPGTDLRLGVAGRKWINCDGHENFPDGEVFTAPVEDATEGTIRYTFPAVHGGRECHDIELTFKAGKVVAARAGKGEDFLTAMLDQDPGARTLGELAIGTNYALSQYTKNTLFDEKIGGTCHLAVGAGWPECGSKNESGLHWDMVCDLRQPGCRLEADGQPILEAGQFTHSEWR